MKFIKNPQGTLSESFNFILNEETEKILYCAAMIIYESTGSRKSQVSIFRTNTRDIINVNLTKNSQEDYNLLDNQTCFSVNKRRLSNKKNRLRKLKNLRLGQNFKYFST